VSITVWTKGVADPQILQETINRPNSTAFLIAPNDDANKIGTLSCHSLFIVAHEFNKIPLDVLPDGTVCPSVLQKGFYPSAL